MANGRTVAPLRKVLAMIIGTVGVFVVFFGAGRASWATVALGAALLILAIGLVAVNALRGGARAWVAGSAHVVSASEPPANSSFGRCELQIVVDAPGLPAAAVKVRDPRVPVSKWPDAGATLPIVVAMDDPRHVRIQWDDVLTHAEAAAEDEFAAYDEARVEPAKPDPDDDRVVVTERVAVVEETAGGGTLDLADEVDRVHEHERRRTDPDREPVIITQTPAGPVVEGRVVERVVDDAPVRGERRAGGGGASAGASAGAGASSAGGGGGTGSIPTPRRKPSPRPRRDPQASAAAGAAGGAAAGAAGGAAAGAATATAGAAVADAGPAPTGTEPAAEPAAEPTEPAAGRADAGAPEAGAPTAGSTAASGTAPAAAATGAGSVTTGEDLADVFTAYPGARPGKAGSIHGVGITVLVTDLARSIAFYRDMLGFFEIDGGDGNAVLASGDTRLVIREVPDLEQVNRRVVQINLEVGDVEATYQDLKAKGVRFTYTPRPINKGERLELWAAQFRDPDGHGVAITQWRTRPSG